VYAIAKDEERHIGRFMASVRTADAVVVADTGSTDGTVEALRAAGASVAEILISPWRFDDARNAALAFVPADVDICVSLDLDEVLSPGWREALERAWVRGTTRLRYRFIASWTGDGRAGTVFWNNRIHARRGYRWQTPIHEVVVWCGEGAESVAMSEELEAQHHPFEQKSRAAYLPMLERAAAESPHEARTAHYLGREYFYARRHHEAIRELRRSLDLPLGAWPAQRGEACRIIARSHEALESAAEAQTWFWKAIAEHPGQRESWVDLSRCLYLCGDFAGGYYAARRALEITERDADYFNEAHAWGALPHDLLSICAWKIGLQSEAAEHAAAAAALDPLDERLRANVRFFHDLALHISEQRPDGGHVSP